MKALLRKSDKLICMTADTISLNEKVYYGINDDTPWKVEKFHTSGEDYLNFEIVEINHEAVIPERPIDFKYKYDIESNLFTLSSEWKSNQVEQK